MTLNAHDSIRLDRLLDEQVEVSVVDRIRQAADLRTAVDRRGHPRQARRHGELIAKARQMAEDIGRRPATVAEARELLGLPERVRA
ncbi:MAG: 3-keto-5-aminohexanoate cleavage protein [Candidatus Limnocylindrales bacterium]